MKTKGKKILTAIIAIICVLAIVAGGMAYAQLSPSDMKNTEIQSFDTGNETLKVGVISDTQLLSHETKLNGPQFEVNLRTSLQVLKNRGVDMILFPGDIGDQGTKESFDKFNEIFNEVYPDEKPILQMIMGNHDYWNTPTGVNITLPSTHRKTYKEAFGVSPWTHYEVNGVHFIGASPASGSMDAGYFGVGKWLDREIQKAVEANPDMPVFVQTHNQPQGTSYGSEDWGDTTLDKVFSKYPNVVNLSGHVHYSLLDERSIWQDAYTVINTQSISYTEMEQGKENGTIPPNPDTTPMGYIIEITSDNFSIARINFAKGENGYEEKADMRWSFDLPYSKDSFKYAEDRAEKNAAPQMTAGEGTFETTESETVLSFTAGTDDDFVHSYMVVIDDSTEQLYFSDFYNGIDDMATTVSLPLKNVEAGTHNIKVYAVDSYDEVSEGFVEIKDVVVK